MSIFDIEKDELLRLSETQLEELIARLAEAEVAVQGHSPAGVSWSGSINAADEGIDIQVQIPVDTLSTGFLERPDTIFQAKKHSMPKGAITKEMAAKKKLSPTISEQAAISGSYIIVSLDDDCSPPMQKDRIKAMRGAVKDDPNSSKIHLDFYDRSKLVQWLRQHPSIMLWVKGKLGQGYSGWQPYGAWSNPPQGADDTLISASGVTVTLPSVKGQKLSIEDAIEPMRGLIRSTSKAVRITGLSGVGKTRIVQALFDENVGADALDRTVAVYVDTGAEPDPSASAMLDRLIAEGQRAIMILDNCPAGLHSTLASKVSASDGQVRLITVEYDIRDDKPQTTEVIHIEAVGPEVAEALLIRRYPGIGQNNARRIAVFADGNARVSLAIAERVEEGESLAQLSDARLFSRLFEQRNDPDDDLQEQAEILSLVYSFSVLSEEGDHNELEVLGSLSGHSPRQLLRSVKKLLDRHVMQQRGHWRAILPHAIANKLAASALDTIPVEQLRITFETLGCERLLMSFAHRLGLLHDHSVAQDIAETWLQPEGLLGQVLELDDGAARMLDYIGPVAPEALLDRIEEELTAADLGNISPYSLRRTGVLKLLQSLAYEPDAFERCVRLLICVAGYEDQTNNYDAVRSKIIRLCQPYLSGTHASWEQRISIMEECILSDDSGRRSLGFKMLSTALSGPPWSGSGIHEFGARPRDFGLQPSYDELIEWRSGFIDVVVRLGTSGDPDLECQARSTMADQFRGMWHQIAMRDKLVDAALHLNAHRPWGEGWKAVRTTIYYDYTKRKDKDDFEPLPEKLAELEKMLEPHGLIPTIMTFVLGKGHDHWALDADFNHDDTNKYSDAEERLEGKALQLGEEFSASKYELNQLGSGLFSSGWVPYRFAFGKGLAKGACDLRVYWQLLVDQLELQPEDNNNFSVFAGFIEEADSLDSALAQELLDQCAQHPELRHYLVSLHPRREFTENDLDRCMSILDDSDIHPSMYGSILWRESYANLPRGSVLDLAQRLLSKPNGDDVVLDALSMKLHGKEESVDTLGSDLRRVGLRAAIQRLPIDRSDSGGSSDYQMECVVGAALRFDSNEESKLEWLDTIVAFVDEHYGYIHRFESAIQTTAASMQEAFLNRMIGGTEEERRHRQRFISDGDSHEPLLAKIDVDVLIEWCSAQSDTSVWAAVAAGITLWSNDGGQSAISISELAIKLLEASSEPEAVLEAFAERAVPSSWSGSRTNAMQPRVDAIARLVEHENAEISMAANLVSEKLFSWIEREKVREQREDENREQRFE